MFLENLVAAIQAVLELQTLFFMIVGVTAGLIAGAIPGFTITMAVVLTLPFTFGMPPVQGLATMLAVFVGGLSGGLMSGTLTGIPGTPSSVATTFDGFPMARKGRPGLALGIGVWSSFFGGIISAILLVTLAPQLARLGLEFGPWDYFALVIFALTITASLAGDNMLKGLIAGALGLLAATIGEDDINGVARFDFGMDALRQGFSFLPVLIGLFAFSQLLSDMADSERGANPLDAGEDAGGEGGAPNPDFSNPLMHRGGESRKMAIRQSLTAIPERPRCKQSVAQHCSNLNRLNGTRLWPGSMAESSHRMPEGCCWGGWIAASG